MSGKVNDGDSDRWIEAEASAYPGLVPPHQEEEAQVEGCRAGPSSRARPDCSGREGSGRSGGSRRCGITPPPSIMTCLIGK